MLALESSVGLGRKGHGGRGGVTKLLKECELIGPSIYLSVPSIHSLGVYFVQTCVHSSFFIQLFIQ